MNIDFEKIFADNESSNKFLQDVINALEHLVYYIQKLFSAFGIKPKYADPDDPLYAGDAVEGE